MEAFDTLEELNAYSKENHYSSNATKVTTEEAVAFIRANQGKFLYVRDAVLHDANLSGLDLSYTNLRGLDLCYTNFSGTNLSYTDLRGARLCYSRLFGANLTGAKWRGASFRGARHNSETILPRGFSFPKVR